MSNAAWRGGGMDWSHLASPKSSPRKAGTHTAWSIDKAAWRTPYGTIEFGVYGSPPSQGRRLWQLSRYRLGEVGEIVVEFVVDRREGRERLGGQRDRLAVAV